MHRRYRTPTFGRTVIYSTLRGPRGQDGSASKDGWAVSRYGVLIGKYAFQKVERACAAPPGRRRPLSRFKLKSGSLGDQSQNLKILLVHETRHGHGHGTVTRRRRRAPVRVAVDIDRDFQVPRESDSESRSDVLVPRPPCRTCRSATGSGVGGGSASEARPLAFATPRPSPSRSPRSSGVRILVAEFVNCQ